MAVALPGGSQEATVLAAMPTPTILDPNPSRCAQVAFTPSAVIADTLTLGAMGPVSLPPASATMPRPGYADRTK